MGHITVLAALIYQHRTGEWDPTITSAIDAAVEA
jgi:hypothetical protein